MQGTEPNLELASELSFGDIADAAEASAGSRRTPVMTSRAQTTGSTSVFKCENFQHRRVQVPRRQRDLPVRAAGPVS